MVMGIGCQLDGLWPSGSTVGTAPMWEAQLLSMARYANKVLLLLIDYLVIVEAVLLVDYWFSYF